MSLNTPRSSRIRYISRASSSSSSNWPACSLRNLAAHLGDRGPRHRTRPGSAVDGGADRAQQRVRQLERVAAGDVEAVEQPVADEVEVGRQRPRPVSPSSERRRSSTSRGIVVGVEQLARVRSPCLSAAISCSSSADAPADTGAAPRIRSSSSAGGTPVHSHDVREQVADRQHRRAREAHVLVDHLDVVVAAARQVRRPAPRRTARRDPPTGARGAP